MENILNKQVSANINIDPKDLKDVVCPTCKNKVFIQITLMKDVPAILSPDGKPAVTMFNMYKCISCEYVFDIPTYLTGKLKEKSSVIITG